MRRLRRDGILELGQYKWYHKKIPNPSVSDSEAQDLSTVLLFLTEATVYLFSTSVLSTSCVSILSSRLSVTAVNQTDTVPCLCRVVTSSFAGNWPEAGPDTKDFWEAWGLFEDGYLPLSLLKSVLGYWSPGRLGRCWQEESISSNMAGRVPDHKAGPGGSQEYVRKVVVP